MTFKLKRLDQCAKCPWKIATDPHDIPDGYSVEKHVALKQTIAEEGHIQFGGSQHVMACHEHDSKDGVHCVGWLHHQLGVGNNIGLRIQMLSCENVRHLKVHGEQHQRFEDTLPDGYGCEEEEY